jgi:hypothetical protein
LNLTRVFDGVRQIRESNILFREALSSVDPEISEETDKLTKVGLKSTARLYIATA